MSIDSMRSYVRDAYSGDKWRRRVDNMPDHQIFAIYTNMKKAEKKQVKNGERL